MGLTEFEAVMSGIFDLDKVEDCRKVIGVLLRDVENANETIGKMRHERQAVADALEAGDTELAKSLCESDSKLDDKSRVDILSNMASEIHRIKNLDNAVLCVQVLEKASPHLALASTESLLLDEMIGRFATLAGVDMFYDEENEDESECRAAL
jgi:hypothetical protein